MPINVAYNHHFESNMVGAHAAFEQVFVTGKDDPKFKALGLDAHYGHGGHGLPDLTDGLWMPRDLGTSDGSLPTHTSFGGANGGEYRKSFHGFAPGYAQVIDSPTEFQITPMQIDTWNRDHMNVTGPVKFVPGPQPRSSLAPQTGVDAIYSGLLECPVTTRIRKNVDEGYVSILAGTCHDTIQTAAECFAAAEKTFVPVAPPAHSAGALHFDNKEGSDATRPEGCVASVDGTDHTLIHVFFNTHKRDPTSNALPAQCGTGASTLVGESTSLVTVAVTLDTVKEEATIALTGPADVWFGVGFNASAMKDAPWAIIVDGTGNVTERKLADQNPGKVVAASVAVTASSVSKATGLRTVTMTRPFKGLTAEHYTFEPFTTGALLPFINAVGSGPTLAYHKNKALGTLVVLPVAGGAPTGCVCASKPAPFGSAKGSLTYVATNQTADVGSGSVGFGNKCVWEREREREKEERDRVSLPVSSLETETAREETPSSRASIHIHMHERFKHLNIYRAV